MYKLSIVLTDDEKEKLEIICKQEKRKKNNMFAFLIEYFYKKEIKEKEVFIKKTIQRLRGVGLEKSEALKYPKNPSDKAYEELMKLRGSNIWEGDLDEMRKGREFNGL